MAVLASAAFETSPAHARQTNAPAPAKPTGATATRVAEGLEHPWSLQFLPDGRMLVTERPGRIRIVGRDGKLSKPLTGAPPAIAIGQGGMLDIALAKDFAISGTVFITFTERRSMFGRNGTSLARTRLVLEPGRERFEGTTVIFRQSPARTGGLHFGSRIAVAPDGNLFVTLGERYRKYEAQELKGHLGKVIRIAPDGTVPRGNPFVGRDGARPEIWSYGHRNPQAAAINPSTGALWIVEHGAQGGDEINVPEAGKNYGWPVITYGRDYSGEKIGIGTQNAGMEQPLYYWDPSIAPSGMAFYNADRFPRWKGNLFVGALKFRSLYRLVLRDGKVVAQERLIREVGERVRDVRQGPDGALYVLTDHENGKIYRVVPKS
ncbi:MAG: PQQ-dependent sugar dehydrogenase [Hyphomicrobiaceae bacterium]|nr:PQQ-dependent sugar dehydrogenase [Hyphomicrobiaceae bacterium]